MATISDILMGQADPSLMCKLCESFLVEPKDLPCKHTFCKSCLQTHCLDNAEEDNFPCPECLKPVRVPDPNIPIMEWSSSIPTNQATARKVQRVVASEKESKQVKCVLCMKKWLARTATKYCKACEECFCDECGTQHWLLRASKEHRVYLLEDIVALQRDPMLSARLDLVFNAKVRAIKSQIGSRAHKGKNDNHIADSETCEITGAAILTDGHVIIADKGNRRIKLFDHRFLFLSSKPVKCHDVLSLNEHFVVVSCPEERCLKLFSIYKKEIEEEMIAETDSECYGLCKFGKNFVVALQGTTIKLAVYDGGVCQETIQTESGNLKLKRPDYITFCGDMGRFFISDSSSRCLKCIKKTGAIVWEKKIQECKGLDMFESLLMVARSDRKSVDIVNASGQIIKSIVNSDDGVSRVCALCTYPTWETDSSKRLIVMDDTNLVHVFFVEDPMMDSDLNSYISKNSTDGGGSNVANDGGDNVASRTCTLL